MGASIAEDKRRELPTKTALEQAGEVMIKDKDGKEIALKSLWEGKPANEQQLIIFIRHFFCGVSAFSRSWWRYQRCATKHIYFELLN